MANNLPVSAAQLDALITQLQTMRRDSTTLQESLPAVLINLEERLAANGMTEELAAHHGRKLEPFLLDHPDLLQPLYERLACTGAGLGAGEAYLLSKDLRERIRPATEGQTIDTTAVVIHDDSPPAPPAFAGVSHAEA